MTILVSNRVTDIDFLVVSDDAVQGANLILRSNVKFSDSYTHNAAPSPLGGDRWGGATPRPARDGVCAVAGCVRIPDRRGRTRKRRAGYATISTASGSYSKRGLCSRHPIRLGQLLSPELLRRARRRSRSGRQEAIEHLSWTLFEHRVIRAVEHPDPVDEDAMDPERIADRARAPAGEIVDPA